MKRVTGIGGVFFKARDKEKLYLWYEEHLGIKREPDGSGVAFRWRAADSPEQRGFTAWAIFPEDTKYFEPSRSSCMINYRVDDLDALLEALHKEGVEIDPKREEYEYGRFAWMIVDPEGKSDRAVGAAHWQARSIEADMDGSGVLIDSDILIEVCEAAIGRAAGLAVYGQFLQVSVLFAPLRPKSGTECSEPEREAV